MSSLEYIDATIIPIVELLVVPAVTIYYFVNRMTQKTLFFTLFLVTYSFSDIINLIDGEALYEPIYYICNGMYILAYMFLIAYILKSLNAKLLIKKFLFQIVVLTILSVYLFSVLFDIVDPNVYESDIVNFVRFTEHSFNLVLLVLLGISFLNYLDKGSKKALVLFTGCVAITFSELLLIGYYYLADYKMLNYFAILLNFSAFLLFYYQSEIRVSDNKTNVFA